MPWGTEPDESCPEDPHLDEVAVDPDDDRTALLSERWPMRRIRLTAGEHESLKNLPPAIEIVGAPGSVVVSGDDRNGISVKASAWVRNLVFRGGSTDVAHAYVDKGYLSLHNCRFEGDGFGVGAQHSVVQLRDCQISTADVGLVAMHGCRATLTDCTVQEHSTIGVKVMYSSVLEASGVRITGGKQAFFLFESRFELQGCSADGQSEEGYWIYRPWPGSKLITCEGGRAGLRSLVARTSLDNDSYPQSRFEGWCATLDRVDEDSLLIEDCKFHNPDGLAIDLKFESVARLRNVEAKGAPALQVIGAASALALDCKFEGVANILKGSAFAAKRCRFENEAGAGSNGVASAIAFEDCTFKSAPLAEEDSAVTSTRLLALRNCTVERGYWGVLARGGEVLIDGLTVHECSGVVGIAKGARALVKKVDGVARCEEGLVVEEGAALATHIRIREATEDLFRVSDGGFGEIWDLSGESADAVGRLGSTSHAQVVQSTVQAAKVGVLAEDDSRLLLRWTRLSAREQIWSGSGQSRAEQCLLDPASPLPPEFTATNALELPLASWATVSRDERRLELDLSHLSLATRDFPSRPALVRLLEALSVGPQGLLGQAALTIDEGTQRVTLQFKDEMTIDLLPLVTARICAALADSQWLELARDAGRLLDHPWLINPDADDQRALVDARARLWSGPRTREAAEYTEADAHSPWAALSMLQTTDAPLPGSFAEIARLPLPALMQRWLSLVDAQAPGCLRPAPSPEDLDDFRHDVLGTRHIPEEINTWLSACDGQLEGTPPVFLGRFRPLSTEEIVSHLVDDGQDLGFRRGSFPWLYDQRTQATCDASVLGGTLDVSGSCPALVGFHGLLPLLRHQVASLELRSRVKLSPGQAMVLGVATLDLGGDWLDPVYLGGSLEPSQVLDAMSARGLSCDDQLEHLTWLEAIGERHGRDGADLQAVLAWDLQRVIAGCGFAIRTGALDRAAGWQRMCNAVRSLQQHFSHLEQFVAAAALGFRTVSGYGDLTRMEHEEALGRLRSKLSTSRWGTQWTWDQAPDTTPPEDPELEMLKLDPQGAVPLTALLSERLPARRIHLPSGNYCLGATLPNGDPEPWASEPTKVASSVFLTADQNVTLIGAAETVEISGSLDLKGCWLLNGQLQVSALRTAGGALCLTDVFTVMANSAALGDSGWLLRDGEWSSSEIVAQASSHAEAEDEDEEEEEEDGEEDSEAEDDGEEEEEEEEDEDGEEDDEDDEDDDSPSHSSQEEH
ncbi:MAG: DUF1266 domain-containing protein [Polyangiaceae bacterium]